MNDLKEFMENNSIEGVRSILSTSDIILEWNILGDSREFCEFILSNITSLKMLRLFLEQGIDLKLNGDSHWESLDFTWSLLVNSFRDSFIFSVLPYNQKRCTTFLRTLLTHDMDVNAVCDCSVEKIRNGKREITFKTLIYQAIDIGDVKILQLCLDHGANLYFRSYPGNVHFIDEAKYDSYGVCGIRKCFSHKLLYRLANRGIDFTDLEVPALSLIHYPYSKGTYTDPSRWSRLVRHLLKLNVSTEIDINGSTPFLQSVIRCNTRMIKVLCRGGANVNAVCEKTGNSALHMISSWRYPMKSVVEELIAAGVSTETRNKDGLTAVEYAEKSGKVEIAKWIIDYASKVDGGTLFDSESIDSDDDDDDDDDDDNEVGGNNDNDNVASDDNGANYHGDDDDDDEDDTTVDGAAAESDNNMFEPPLDSNLGLNPIIHKRQRVL